MDWSNLKPSPNSKSKALAWLLIPVAVIALLAAACGGGSGGDSSSSGGDGNNSNADTSDVSGTVNISGSSTVEPVSVRVAELFASVASGVSVTVDGPGTGDGFKLFCDGETDISGASRAIKPSEAETCQANGIEYVELEVGIDGIAVMTSERNSVECLSFADLYALVGPESNGIGNWRDAQSLATELGSTTQLPDLGLDVFGPGEESGTFDSFIELVLEHLAEDRGQEPTTRTDYGANANDSIIIQGIESANGSLGWVGFAYANNVSNIKLLDVDGGDGCVPVNPTTVADGSYPISRPLFIYVNAAKAAANPAVTAYVDFYVTTGIDRAVAEVGYVTLTDAAKAETRAAWDNR